MATRVAATLRKETQAEVEVVSGGLGEFSIDINNQQSEGSDVGVPNAPVPEPTSMLLLSTGLVGVAGMVRRKLKAR